MSRSAWTAAWRLARAIYAADHAEDCDFDPQGSWCTCGLDERWQAAMEVPMFSEAYDCLWSRFEPDLPYGPSPMEVLRRRALGLGMLDDAPF